MRVCRHCGKIIRFESAPAAYVSTGYYGYWYHVATDWKYCQQGTSQGTAAEPDFSVLDGPEFSRGT